MYYSRPKTFPQCENTCLLSPGVSEIRLSLQDGRFCKNGPVLGLIRADGFNSTWPMCQDAALSIAIHSTDQQGLKRVHWLLNCERRYTLSECSSFLPCHLLHATHPGYAQRSQLTMAAAKQVPTCVQDGPKQHWYCKLASCVPHSTAWYLQMCSCKHDA